jgi:peroxiredoxin
LLLSVVGLGLVVLALGMGWWLGARPDGSDVQLSEDPSGVVARVNGQPITARQVDVELLMQQAMRAQNNMQLTSDPAALAAFRRDILDTLVDQTLVLQDAAARGMSIDATQAVLEMPSYAPAIDPAALRAAGGAAGVSDAEFDAWAVGQVLVARYLRDPAVQATGQAQAAQGGGLPGQVTTADLAAVLEETADVRFSFAGFGDSAENRELQMAREGELAPDFTLTTPTGEVVKLSDLRGKPVLLNFWATWCGPCKVEMPLFNHVYEKNSERGLVVLGVNVQESATLVAPFQQEFGLKFPVVLDEKGQVATLYRVRALPTSMFIGPDGMLEVAHRGAIVQRSTLLDIVRQIMPDVGT